MITFKKINERFSEIVGKYLSEGYVINTGTMSGTQGENAKIDMTDGKTILRILLDDDRCSIDEPDSVSIIVGKCTNKARPNKNNSFDTIWNHELVEVYRETFYALSRSPYNAFGTKEEAEKCRKLRRERRDNYTDDWYQRVRLSDASRKIALKYIRREYYSSYKLSDIESVYKKIRHGNVTYQICAKGKTFSIR